MSEDVVASTGLNHYSKQDEWHTPTCQFHPTWYVDLPFPLCFVQWGDNQNGVFEFIVKGISMLPTLIAS